MTRLASHSAGAKLPRTHVFLTTEPTCPPLFQASSKAIVTATGTGPLSVSQSVLVKPRMEGRK